MTAQRALCLSLAVLLYGATWKLVEPEPRALLRLLQTVPRPFVLPQLWREFARASHEGSLGEAIARARAIMRLLPEWTDGHMHFAAMLAFESSQREATPERALDRLQAALAWLQQAAADDPASEPELLCAMASFVLIRTRQSPELLRLWRVRNHEEAEFSAERWLARAEQQSPSRSLGERRAYLTVRLAAAALRTGDVARGREWLALARERLTTVTDQDNASMWRAALAKVQRLLDGDTSITRAELLADPLTHELAQALPR